ncbi:MAG TPA: SDR family NAD(P)-dependent oxidoreductase [Rhizomicrobium sp.]|nr:SDR family NAD(P)-dependent oxidoreductase [Rhizomicrobium sp.]
MAVRPLVVLAGLGEGLGVALAAAFASAGYDVAGLARTTRVAGAAKAAVGTAGGRYSHRRVDLTDGTALREAVAPFIERIETVIHLAHRVMKKPLDETAPAEFEEAWRVGCFSAFLTAQIVVPALIARGGGTIVLSGASASLRGAAGFNAFASAKFALRGFAQALARELEPRGVHVGHVVLDGLIDEPQTDVRFGRGDAPRMTCEDVAALAFATQPRSVRTYEFDLRPWSKA